MENVRANKYELVVMTEISRIAKIYLRAQTSSMRQFRQRLPSTSATR